MFGGAHVGCIRYKERDRERIKIRHWTFYLDRLASQYTQPTVDPYKCSISGQQFESISVGYTRRERDRAKQQNERARHQRRGGPQAGYSSVGAI